MRQVSKSLLIRSACALALGFAVIALPETAMAQVSVSITLAPPALPLYEQPMLVEEGGIWAPGYWAYNQDGYVWVPGAWVQPPEVGLLWTPGYWGWDSGGYAWNAGYWGPTVGFYGGIAYGFGYSGHGYTGGHWQGQQFYYNTEVSHVNVTNIHNVYHETVVNNVNRVSFNGGKGGIMVQPTAAEQAAARTPHHAATAAQTQNHETTLANHSPSASANRGKPEVAAAPKPLEKSAPVHAKDLPPVAHQPARNTGNVARDTANQRAKDDLSDSQEKQRQELQQRQAADHEQAAKQPTANGNAQALERQHQGQTQAMAQRHTMEQKSLQETQEAKPAGKHEAPHG